VCERDGAEELTGKFVVFRDGLADADFDSRVVDLIPLVPRKGCLLGVEGFVLGVVCGLSFPLFPLRAGFATIGAFLTLLFAILFAFAIALRGCCFVVEDKADLAMAGLEEVGDGGVLVAVEALVNCVDLALTGSRFVAGCWLVFVEVVFVAGVTAVLERGFGLVVLEVTEDLVAESLPF